MEINIVQPRPDEVGEETLAQVPDPKGTKDVLPRGKESTKEATDTDIEAELKIPQDGGSASKDPLGVIEVGDSSLFPSISSSMMLRTRGLVTREKPTERRISSVVYLLG